MLRAFCRRPICEIQITAPDTEPMTPRRQLAHKELVDIVDWYAQRSEPTPIRTIRDVVTEPNSGLILRVISAENLDANNLSGLLEDRQALHRRLWKYAPKGVKPTVSPQAGPRDLKELYSFEMLGVVMHLYEAAGEGGVGSLCLGTPYKSAFKYPSGWEVDYFAIQDEWSYGGGPCAAFARLSEDGSVPPNIYVRSVIVTYLTAIGRYLVTHGPLGRYRDHLPDLEYWIKGLFIAHEISEMHSGFAGQDISPSLSRELRSDYKAKHLAIRHRIPDGAYELVARVCAYCGFRSDAILLQVEASRRRRARWCRRLPILEELFTSESDWALQDLTSLLQNPGPLPVTADSNNTDEAIGLEEWLERLFETNEDRRARYFRIG